MKRVVALGDPGSTLWEPTWSEAQAAARQLNIEIVPSLITSPDQLDSAFAKLDRGADALFVSPLPVFWVNRRKVIDLAAKSKLPAVYEFRIFTNDGGLMSYGVDYVALNKKSARHVDRILKGASPADLPVEQPTDYELVINLKTAKALGIAIPQSLLLRAAEVIQ